MISLTPTSSKYMLHLSLKSPLWFALFYKEKPLKVHPSRGPYRFIFYIFAAISYIKDKNPAGLLLCGVFVCCARIGLPTSCVPLPSALFFKGPPQKGAAFLWGKEARRRWFVGSAAPDKRAKPAPTRFGTKRSCLRVFCLLCEAWISDLLRPIKHAIPLPPQDAIFIRSKI